MSRVVVIIEDKEAFRSVLKKSLKKRLKERRTNFRKNIND